MEGKQAVVFYDDGGAISRKDGKITKEENGWIHLLLHNGSNIAIAKERIVRIEFVGE